MHLLHKYLGHKFLWNPDAGSDPWRPLMAFYYLTTGCNLTCTYCKTGPFLPAEAGAGDALLPGPQVLELLARVRRHTDIIALTGGEPLTHPDFAQILERVRSLRFRAVILATNGLHADRFLDSIVPNVDYLVISLDTLREEVAGGLCGLGGGGLRRVLDNIEQLARHPDRRYHISLSAVITPEHIAELYPVFRYCQEQGLEFAAAPQLVGLRPHPDLPGNPEYVRFFDFLIEQKRRGARIYGTVRYLEHMRDVQPFVCHPLGMLVVAPRGEVWYPCLEAGRVVGNLLEEPELEPLRRRGEQLCGPLGPCPTPCHSACMVNLSLLLHHPADQLGEALLWGRRFVRGTPVATGPSR